MEASGTSEANQNNSSPARQQNTRTSVHTHQEGNALSLIQTILLYPFTLSFKFINTIFYFISTVFPFIPRLTGYYPANRTATHSIQKAYNPKDNAARVIRAFEETYGQCGINFYEDGFAQAYDDAKKNLKFLIVILQSDEHDFTAPFNRKVLTDSRVVDFFTRNDTLIWLGNVGNSEGFQIAESLKCTTFPFVLLVAPTPKSANSSAIVMKSLVSVQGEENDPMHFISTLEEKIQSHLAIRARLVHDREEREMERRLREEQDLAFQRSLETDRERARRSQEEKKRKEAEERERALREEAEKQKTQLLEEKKREWKYWRLSKLGPEFIPNSTTTKAARIGIRTADGSRLIRKFAGTDSIEAIYAYVECYDMLESLDESKLKDIYENIDRYPKPDGYTHEYKFKLASSMPRKIIEPFTDVQIQTEKAIWPSGNLVVEEDLDEE